MLAPAQFISALGSLCPSSLGFLIYNWYTQIMWYRSVKAKQVHALSILFPHFNLVYAVSYLGGVSSGHPAISIPLWVGTAGAMVMNTRTAWVSWRKVQPEGFGKYQFYLFGWRTLSRFWHKFLFLWQIADAIITIIFMLLALALAIWGLKFSYAEKDFDMSKRFNKRHHKFAAIPIGAAIMLLFSWPLIVWAELIVARNHIDSETDWVAVGLFIAQVASMFVPSLPCVYSED